MPQRFAVFYATPLRYPCPIPWGGPPKGGTPPNYGGFTWGVTGPRYLGGSVHLRSPLKSVENMGKTSRTKGKAFERRCVRWLNSFLGEGAIGRGPAMLEAHGGATGIDLGGEGTRLVVQCKKGKRVNPLRALREVEGSATEGQIPIAVVEQDRVKGTPRTAAVLMSPETFVALWCAGMESHEEGLVPWELEVVEVRYGEVFESAWDDVR